DALLTADHSDRREALAVVVLPHEPDIIDFLGSPDEPDRRQISPLKNRAIDPFRPRHIGVDNVGNDSARPAIPVHRTSIRRLTLTERNKQEYSYRGRGPKEANHVSQMTLVTAAMENKRLSGGPALVRPAEFLRAFVNVISGCDLHARTPVALRHSRRIWRLGG